MQAYKFQSCDGGGGGSAMTPATLVNPSSRLKARAVPVVGRETSDDSLRRCENSTKLTSAASGSGSGCGLPTAAPAICWRPLVAVTLVLMLSRCASSLPANLSSIAISNELPVPYSKFNQISADFNQSAASDGNDTLAKDFASGVASSDNLNLTDEFQDQHDSTLRVLSNLRVDDLRKRNKQQRIVTIQKTILERLGLFQTPNISNSYNVSDDYRRRMEKVFHLMQSQPQNVQSTQPVEIYAKRVQSFYPSCSLPRNMDREVWTDSNLFHIYYEIPVPQLMEGASMTVSSAKLRLYKMAPVTDNSVTVSSAIGVTNLPAAGIRMLDKSASSVSNRETGSLSCDERVRITVFQYTKPLKKTKKVVKKKRKLIDSRMVAMDFEGWLEFDIRSSARDWLDNSSRNLGLEIELEDSLANTRNPSEFLRNMNCSEDDRIRHQIGDEDPTALFENETYPTLDLKTIEIEDPVDVVPKSSKTPATNNHRPPTMNRSLHKRHIVTNMCGGNNDGSSYTLDEAEKFSETSNCCKKETYVKFSDFEEGHKILEPSGFYTKMCVGLCNPIKGEEYICAPKTKEDIEVLVLDNSGNRVKMTLPDLVTKTCSCQLKSLFQQASYDNY